jgi:hypothetical protein
MTQTLIHTVTAPLKRSLPEPFFRTLRSVGTAVLTPLNFSLKTGHLRSSFANMAKSAAGEPLPWYSYPCFDFLKFRNYKDKSVLEFGAGQSTIWWAKRAKNVVAFDANEDWYNFLKPQVPANVSLFHASSETPERSVADVRGALAGVPDQKFDVVIIDGLQRKAMVDVAIDWVSPTGIIVCDDSEGSGFFDAFQGKGFQRVDFYGYVPAVVLPHCTSIFFKPGAFVFSDRVPIQVVT